MGIYQQQYYMILCPVIVWNIICWEFPTRQGCIHDKRPMASHRHRECSGHYPQLILLDLRGALHHHVAPQNGVDGNGGNATTCHVATYSLNELRLQWRHPAIAGQLACDRIQRVMFCHLVRSISCLQKRGPFQGTSFTLPCFIEHTQFPFLCQWIYCSWTWLFHSFPVNMMISIDYS